MMIVIIIDAESCSVSGGVWERYNAAGSGQNDTVLDFHRNATTYCSKTTNHVLLQWGSDTVQN